MPLEPVWREFLEASPISWNHMFTVHVHAPPGIKYPKGNLFADKEVKDPVLVTWGNHSMVCYVMDFISSTQVAHGIKIILQSN
jgi:hypothetical protein